MEWIAQVVRLDHTVADLRLLDGDKAVCMSTPRWNLKFEVREGDIVKVYLDKENRMHVAPISRITPDVLGGDSK